MPTFRSLHYTLAALLGEANAVKRDRSGRRLGRRLAGHLGTSNE